jgi:hypothetical protein
MARHPTTRRELLGALGVTTTVALAGCSLTSSDDGDDGDDAIDPENDDISAVLEAAGSASEELRTYRAERSLGILIELETFSGTRSVSERRVMEEANGVYIDSNEETDVSVDLEAEAYKSVGAENGEALGQTLDQEIKEYYIDGTLYEFDDGPAGGEWTVDEDAEFDPPANTDDFADQASDVTDDLTVESRNDGDSVAITGSFSDVPEAFEEGPGIGANNPFQQITTYDIEAVFATETGRPEKTTLTVDGEIDETSMGQLLGEEPDSASGSFSITVSVEFVAFDESVEIELPDGVSA